LASAETEAAAAAAAKAANPLSACYIFMGNCLSMFPITNQHLKCQTE
jgi:hypothetical protein